MITAINNQNSKASNNVFGGGRRRIAEKICSIAQEVRYEPITEPKQIKIMQNLKEKALRGDFKFVGVSRIDHLQFRTKSGTKLSIQPITQQTSSFYPRITVSKGKQDILYIESHDHKGDSKTQQSAFQEVAKVFMGLFPKGNELQAVIDKNTQSANKKVAALQKQTKNIKTSQKASATEHKAKAITQILNQNVALFETSQKIESELAK